MERNTARNTHPPASGLLAFNRWLKDTGIGRATGWRWRRDGIIQTLNIYGRCYISREEIARFEEAAKLGEFARASHPPRSSNIAPIPEGGRPHGPTA